jgi:hypothetical protein
VQHPWRVVEGEHVHADTPADDPQDADTPARQMDRMLRR